MNRQLHKLAVKLSQQPRKIFLIDALGAMLTATLLAFLLAPFEHFFGMPSHILYFLAMIAMIFACYSLACFFIVKHNWQLFLKIIAIANLMYCVLSVGLVVQYYQVITLWGIVYFSLEVILVVALVILEWKVTKKGKE
jgi:predicted membrane-bound spermidine synthase